MQLPFARPFTMPRWRWPAGGRRPLALAAGVLAVAVLAPPWAVVPAGHRGVVTTFGRVHPEPLGEGLHWRIPVAQQVLPINVQIQKGEGGDVAASRDLQHVDVKVALAYRLEPARTAAIYRDIGPLAAVGERIILPAVHEAVKAVVAGFTAEALVTQRTEVRERIRAQLEERLRPRGIVVEDFAITGFSFSKEFEAAIEAKSRAEQERMKAERDLARIRIEGEQRLARAQAEAEALKLERAQVTPELLQWEALRRWDGRLPEVVLGAAAGPGLPAPWPIAFNRALPSAAAASRPPADGRAAPDAGRVSHGDTARRMP